ncbi:hypothetical protein [Halioxenophilus sp. WMMB6]|uniref:hypothetical protein n=1 Tax=Halioxenophilus sp. WMMB6 TaxID=3073815 RepID=UPI00295F56B1|nr:hypothetical protein [Halioxenophilus sp. WMMB6]
MSMIEQLSQALAAGNASQAQQLITAISQQQDSANAQVPLINLCLKHGFHQQGLQCFARAATDEQFALQILPLLQEPLLKSSAELTLAYLTVAHQAQPQNLQLLLTLADNQLQFNQLQEAEQVLTKALQTHSHPEILARLAEVYFRWNRFHDAKACAQLGLAMSANNPQSLINLAVVEKALNNLQESARLFSQALELESNNFYAHINLAHLYLTTGQFKLGWAENEWRWQDAHCNKEMLPLPEWQGEQNVDHHLLLWADQGLGDQIQYLSLLPQVKAKVTVKVDSRLHSLLTETCTLLDADYQGDFSEFDSQLSLGSLPRFLVHQFSDLKPSTAYLQLPSPVAGANLKTNQKRWLGFSWRGGRFGTAAASRSLELSLWQPLFALENIQWVNLQYDATEQEIEWLASHNVITPEFDLKNDLLQLAGAMTSLDGYFGVDNSTIHLAGALGVKSWLLLTPIADWRWFTDAEYCYWYQSVQLLRTLPLNNEALAAFYQSAQALLA